MNYLTIKQLAELAIELNIHVGLLEIKLKSCNIMIKTTESSGFRSSRRNILSLYR